MKRYLELGSVLLLSAGIALAAEKSSSTRPAEKTPAEQRQHIKEAVITTVGRDVKVTSEHRGNSAAHQRGAIDISTKDLPATQRHTEAKQISKTLGKDYTVVVEEVHRVPKGQQGPEAQVNTAYRAGTQGNVRTGEIKASATHTHIQPDKKK
jgi:hypothetical protein